MIVDKSLSRGLADSVLQEFCQIRDSFTRRIGSACRGIPYKRSAVKAKAEALRSVGEELSLTQIIVNHHKWRWATFNVFLPLVKENDAGANNRLVQYPMVRFQFANQRRTDVDGGTRTLLCIQEHAFERLFLRLNITNASQVKEEVHDAMCFSLLLCPAALKLELRQMVLPTRSGVFLCGVDESNQWLVAKTWLATEGLQQRLEEVIEEIRRIYDRAGGESAMAERLGSISIHDDPALIDLPVELLNSLTRFHWLREEYSVRSDPGGEIWMRARKQASEVAVQDPPAEATS